MDWTFAKRSWEQARQNYQICEFDFCGSKHLIYLVRMCVCLCGDTVESMMIGGIHTLQIYMFIHSWAEFML